MLLLAGVHSKPNTVPHIDATPPSASDFWTWAAELSAPDAPEAYTWGSLPSVRMRTMVQYFTTPKASQAHLHRRAALTAPGMVHKINRECGTGVAGRRSVEAATL